MNTSSSIRPCDAPPACRRADRVSQARGFSLIELTIVLAVIVIASAVALPRYWSSIGRYRVDMAARRLAADLALAQARARATGQFRNVKFSRASLTYTLLEENPLNASAAHYAVNLDDDPFTVSVASFSLSDSGVTITFDGYGQPAQGASIKLSAAGHTRTITLDRSSGAISVATP